MNFKLILLFFILIFSLKTYAIVEVGFDFGYSKQVYGTQRQNSTRDRSYAGSFALYLFDLTAIELNYSYSNEITIENPYVLLSGTDFALVSMQTTVRTEIFGVGLRQSFAGKKSRLKPIISLGYAKQFVRGLSTFTLKDLTNNIHTTYDNGGSYKRIDSVFATFSLQLRLVGAFFIKGSVKTVFSGL